jgi:hypothetical protein
MLCSLSSLETEKIDAIQNLEKELGKTVLAFSCHDIKPAQLSAADLEKIQDLEKKLSLSIVAVDA